MHTHACTCAWMRVHTRMHMRVCMHTRASHTSRRSLVWAAVEVSSAVEARLRHVSDELDASRADALATSDEAQARREEAEETRRRWALHACMNACMHA